MTKLLYAWRSGQSGTEIRHRVVTSNEMLTLDDNGRTIYIDANEDCIVTLPLTSEAPYGYTVTFVYVNENEATNNGSLGIAMQNSDVDGGYLLRGRIQPLNPYYNIKRFLFNNNTRIGDIITVTLLGEGKGIYTGSVSEEASINFDD